MVYYRDNLPNKITDSAYLINLDKYCDIGTHWIISYALNDNVTFFDSFGVEHIPKKKKKKLLEITTFNQIYWEYKHIIQECADIFVLVLLVLCFKLKASKASVIFFHQIIWKKMMT